MITIRIRGGLGNQLFQYAFGYAMAKRSGQPLALDITFFSHQPKNTGKRALELMGLSLPPFEIAEKNLRLKLLTNRHVGAVTRHFSKFTFPVGNRTLYVKEPHHKYIADIDLSGSRYFDGYWQSEKYFSQYREELLELFRPQVSFAPDLCDFMTSLSSQNSVAIHMRKGDFGGGGVRQVGHLLSADYYLNAIQAMREKVENPHFYIFSDDTTWAKEQLKGAADCHFTGDLIKTDIFGDLFSIAACRHGIMSASTFSWWGNWLRKKEGTVIVPKGHYYNDHFYKEAWIQL